MSTESATEVKPVSQMAAPIHKEALPEHAFKLHKTTIEIRNVGELAEAFEIMSDESFGHHVTDKRNDFATWVSEVVGDNELSNRLRGVVDRQKAQEVVKQRIKEVQQQSSPQQYTYKSPSLFGFGLWDVIIGFVAGLIIGLFLGHYLIPGL